MNTVLSIAILAVVVYGVRAYYFRQVEAMRETAMWESILADIRAGKYDNPEDRA